MTFEEKIQFKLFYRIRHFKLNSYCLRYTLIKPDGSEDIESFPYVCELLSSLGSDVDPDQKMTDKNGDQLFCFSNKHIFLLRQRDGHLDSRICAHEKKIAEMNRHYDLSMAMIDAMLMA